MMRVLLVFMAAAALGCYGAVFASPNLSVKPVVIKGPALTTSASGHLPALANAAKKPTLSGQPTGLARPLTPVSSAAAAGLKTSALLPKVGLTSEEAAQLGADLAATAAPTQAAAPTATGSGAGGFSFAIKDSAVRLQGNLGRIPVDTPIVTAKGLAITGAGLGGAAAAFECFYDKSFSECKKDAVLNWNESLQALQIK